MIVFKCIHTMKKNNHKVEHGDHGTKNKIHWRTILIQLDRTELYTQ
jgi:hypothetical protein